MAVAPKAADTDKTMKEVALALNKIHPDKMMGDVSASLKNVNQHFNSVENEKAFAEAVKEMEKAQLELKKIDQKVIKNEPSGAKELGRYSGLNLYATMIFAYKIFGKT